ncbi:hypothetical protein MUP79_01890 [Candidatus Bathyarchaeota archaeon]|nr:hypothetical protein [Candidatus Bathyarchaeota archaeon]
MERETTVRRLEGLNKMAVTALGALLIIIALILGAVDYLGYYDFGPMFGRHMYFYSVMGVIGLIGIILAVWPMMKQEAPKKETP